MRIAVMMMTGALMLLPAARLARADGWWAGCHENENNGEGGCNNDSSGDPGGCDCDGNPDTACNTGHADAASVGSGLALVALVTYGLRRRRK